MPLNIKALALALGTLWGAALLLLGWIAPLDWGVAAVTVLGSIYIGFEPGLVGGLIGGIWGLVDGAISGALVAWLYNVFERRA